MSSMHWKHLNICKMENPKAYDNVIVRKSVWSAHPFVCEV